MAAILEAVMLLCFGASWPFNIRKTWLQRSPAGKSLVFLWLIEIGYLAGIAGKFIKGVDYVAALWILNALLVAVDLGLVYHFLHAQARTAPLAAPVPRRPAPERSAAD